LTQQSPLPYDGEKIVKPSPWVKVKFVVRVQDHRKNRSDNVEETQTSCKVVDATSMKAFLVTYILFDPNETACTNSIHRMPVYLWQAAD